MLVAWYMAFRPYRRGGAQSAQSLIRRSAAWRSFAAATIIASRLLRRRWRLAGALASRKSNRAHKTANSISGKRSVVTFGISGWRGAPPYHGGASRKLAAANKLQAGGGARHRGKRIKQNAAGWRRHQSALALAWRHRSVRLGVALGAQLSLAAWRRRRRIGSMALASWPRHASGNKQHLTAACVALRHGACRHQMAKWRNLGHLRKREAVAAKWWWWRKPWRKKHHGSHGGENGAKRNSAISQRVGDENGEENGESGMAAAWRISGSWLVGG